MRETSRLVSLLILVLFIPGISASSPEADPLTLEECISLALGANPLVLSSEQQYGASLARIHQAKAISQPSLDFDSDIQPRFLDFRGSGESYLGLSQTLEFPGKRALRGRIARLESNEMRQDIQLLKLDLVYQIKEGFFGLLLAQEKLKFAEQNRALSLDFLQKAELKFETGDVAEVELLRARVEAAKSETGVRRASNALHLAKSYLNFLMARKKNDPLSVTGTLKYPPLDLDLEGLTSRALAFRPELKRIKHSQQIENLKKKQGILSYLPDFDLGLSRHRLEGEGTFWDVTLSLPIPLFFWQPKKGEIAEAESNSRALAFEAEHLEHSIMLEVEEAYRNALSTQRQIRLFEEEIIKQAEEVYNMYLFSYQEGEIGALELIDARRTLIEANESYADARYDYALSLAALERSIGESIQGEN
jgi:outer membrane protein TolC